MPTKIKPLATQPKPDRIGTFAIPHTFKVDRAAGVLSDLQLMASGREAKGHGLYIDERTVETGLEVVNARGGRLKGYATHNHGGAATWYWSQDKSELDVAGFFSSISIEKGQLVAGRFEFYDTYKAASPEEYARVMEVAEKTPELLGLSVEVWGYAVFVGADGTEYSQRPDDVELANDGMPTLRITDLFAAAFVSEGAATDGLFAKLSAKTPPGLRQFFSALREYLSTDPEGTAAPAGKTAGHSDAPSIPAAKSAGTASPNESAMNELIKSIKAKFGTDKVQFSQAMTILGNKPDITIEALEAEMVRENLAAAQAEVTALRTQVATLTTERDTARTQIAQLTTERDDFKSKFDAIKTSGHPGVNLNAPAPSAGAAPSANPWAPGSINETEQARIFKADPARATTLMAQAAELAKTKK